MTVIQVPEVILILCSIWKYSASFDPIFCVGFHTEIEWAKYWQLQSDSKYALKRFHKSKTLELFVPTFC